MDDIAIFDTFFKAEALAVGDVATCIGTKFFKSVAPPKVAFPYATWKVVPLTDRTGQARTSVITRLLVDVKFMDSLPLTSTIAAAIEALNEHFRASRTFDSNGYRISVRRQSAIDSSEIGATSDEQIMTFGSTYAVWMSKTS